MEHEAATRIASAIAAQQLLWSLAYFVFFAGVVALALYIRKASNLTIRETFLAIFGLMRLKRNRVVNVLHALVIIIPLLLMSYVITSYGGA